MAKSLDKDSGQTELAPVSPKEENEDILFISDDESLALLLESGRTIVNEANGQSERVEPKLIQFEDHVFRASTQDEITLKHYGTKPVKLVRVLREHAKYGIAYREATPEVNTETASDYLSRMDQMSNDQLRAESVRFGYNPLQSDTREKIMLEIVRRNNKQ